VEEGVELRRQTQRQGFRWGLRRRCGSREEAKSLEQQHRQGHPTADESTCVSADTTTPSGFNGAHGALWRWTVLIHATTKQLRQQSTWQIRERVMSPVARRTPGMAHWCEKRHRLFNVMMLRTHRPCLTSCREEGSFAPKSAVLRCSIFLLTSTPHQTPRA